MLVGHMSTIIRHIVVLGLMRSQLLMGAHEVLRIMMTKTMQMRTLGSRGLKTRWLGARFPLSQYLGKSCG
jgi:hypothetical protein